MKTIKEIIKNYYKYKTPIEDRLGKRFCQFLNDEQMKKLGFEYDLEEGQERLPVIPFTEENVLKQLKEDLEFGIEKAVGHRGISAGLMHNVCLGWCAILENGLDELYENDYGWYGDKLFKAIDKKYNFGLINENTFNKEFYEEW